jgi:hypothetical protein
MSWTCVPAGKIISAEEIWICAYSYYFEALPQNFEKRLLASSCLSICPSVRLTAWNNLVPIGRIFVKFDIRVLKKICQKNPVALKYDNKGGYFA